MRQSIRTPREAAFWQMILAIDIAPHDPVAIVRRHVEYLEQADLLPAISTVFAITRDAIEGAQMSGDPTAFGLQPTKLAERVVAKIEGTERSVGTQLFQPT